MNRRKVSNEIRQMLWKDTNSGKAAWGVYRRHIDSTGITVTREKARAKKRNGPTLEHFLRKRMKKAKLQRK